MESEASNDAPAAAFVCPCTYRGTSAETYASVLVLGQGHLQGALHDMTTRPATCVANTLSYCSQCRRITPCLNGACSIQENIMHWPRQHAFYTACAEFIKTWPTHARGTKPRSRSKKHNRAEEAGSEAGAPASRTGFRFRA